MAYVNRGGMAGAPALRLLLVEAVGSVKELRIGFRLLLATERPVLRCLLLWGERLILPKSNRVLVVKIDLHHSFTFRCKTTLPRPTDILGIILNLFNNVLVTAGAPLWITFAILWITIFFGTSQCALDSLLRLLSSLIRNSCSDSKPFLAPLYF